MTLAVERIERAAADLESANRDLADFLASLPDDQWRTASTAEGWPVIAAAYHVADGYRLHILWLDHLRLGHAVPGTPEDLDKANAQAVSDAAELAPNTVMSAVALSGRLLAAHVRGLQLHELTASASHGPLGGRRITVEEMLDIAVWHVREHLRNMRSAVAS